LKKNSIALGIACLAVWGTSLAADSLPKSGAISIHTGWKSTSEIFQQPEKNSIGHGSLVGINFNDKGSGPLHGGPALCVLTFLGKEGGASGVGYCAFGDVDGDRIFVSFDGGLTDGTNRIVGGTGKYTGIKGGGPWKCAYNDTPGVSCTQRFDYQLP
jgi:hypothetical protein